MENVFLLLFQLQSNHSALEWLIYQGFFPMSSLALVLLRIKVRHEKKPVGMEHKTFYDPSSGNLWCHVCNIFCLLCHFCIFFGRVLSLATHSNDKQHTEESQSVAFIPFRNDFRKKCHA